MLRGKSCRHSCIRELDLSGRFGEEKIVLPFAVVERRFIDPPSLVLALRDEFVALCFHRPIRFHGVVQN